MDTLAEQLLAAALDVPPASLEPAWSKAVELPKAGDTLPDSAVAMILVRAPRACVARRRSSRRCPSNTPTTRYGSGSASATCPRAVSASISI